MISLFFIILSYIKAFSIPQKIDFIMRERNIIPAFPHFVHPKIPPIWNLRRLDRENNLENEIISLENLENSNRECV